MYDQLHTLIHRPETHFQLAKFFPFLAVVVVLWLPIMIVFVFGEKVYPPRIFRGRSTCGSLSICELHLNTSLLKVFREFALTDRIPAGMYSVTVPKATRKLFKTRWFTFGIVLGVSKGMPTTLRFAKQMQNFFRRRRDPLRRNNDLPTPTECYMNLLHNYRQVKEKAAKYCLDEVLRRTVEPYVKTGPMLFEIFSMGFSEENSEE